MGDDLASGVGYNSGYGGLNSGYGGYSSGYGLGGYGMMGGMGMGGMMGGVMQKMSYVSMSIGLLGQGVQMLGMNAEHIQSAIRNLVEMLAQSTARVNNLCGCESDQSTGPHEGYRVDSYSGSLMPKATQELAEEKKNAAGRRRTARWVIALAIAALSFWNGRRRGRRQAASMAEEVGSGR